MAYKKLSYKKSGLRPGKKPIKTSRIEPTALLTPLVKKQARGLSGAYRRIFDEWARSKTVGWLPNGVPYKISDMPFARVCSGLVLVGINKPLILVSSDLTAAERKSCAEHEYFEWSRSSRSRNARAPDHAQAFRMQNPKLRDSSTRKAKRFEKVFIESNREDHISALRKFGEKRINEIAVKAKKKGHFSARFKAGGLEFEVFVFKPVGSQDLSYEVVARFPDDVNDVMLNKHMRGEGNNIVEPHLIAKKGPGAKLRFPKLQLI